MQLISLITVLPFFTAAVCGLTAKDSSANTLVAREYQNFRYDNERGEYDSAPPVRKPDVYPYALESNPIPGERGEYDSAPPVRKLGVSRYALDVCIPIHPIRV